MRIVIGYNYSINLSAVFPWFSPLFSYELALWFSIHWISSLGLVQYFGVLAFVLAQHVLVLALDLPQYSLEFHLHLIIMLISVLVFVAVSCVLISQSSCQSSVLGSVIVY